MQRRTFLKTSAIGIGTFASMCSDVLKSDAGGSQPEFAQSDRSGLVAMADERQLGWGINAVVLKSPWTTTPSMDDLLSDQEHTLVLNSFYRAGGDNRPATPTEFRIAYDSNALFAVFQCAENNMSFPAVNHEADWYSLDGSPARSEISTSVSSPPFPDEVDFFIRPDRDAPLCYHFAATLDGLQFGCERLLRPNLQEEEKSDQDASASTCLSKITAFEARVVRRTNEWIAVFQVPWKTLGGKPRSYFGLLPVRTRWRNGEFSSPPIGHVTMLGVSRSKQPRHSLGVSILRLESNARFQPKL